MATAAPKNKRKPTVKSAPPKEGKIIDPDASSFSLVDYLDQFRKAASKKKGKALEGEIDAYLDAAKTDLTDDEYEKFRVAIAPHRVKKELKREQRAQKKDGPVLTRAEYRKNKFLLAEASGEWYPGYPKGCTECKGTDRKHYSGGKCTRCYTEARNKRLIAEGKMIDPEVKKQEREAAKAKRDEDRAAKAKERSDHAAERAAKKAEADKKAKAAVEPKAKAEPKKKAAAKKPAAKKPAAKKAPAKKTS